MLIPVAFVRVKRIRDVISNALFIAVSCLNVSYWIQVESNAHTESNTVHALLFSARE